MARGPEHGPAGLEGIHYWTALAGHQITLNDHAASSPQYRILRMPGFRSLPEIVDASESKYGRIGETPLLVDTLGKTYTIEGEIRGATLDDVREGEVEMHRAFNDRDNPGTFDHKPTTTWGGGSITDWYTSDARVMALEIDETAENMGGGAYLPWRLPFLMTMHMHDPRFTWTALQVSATNATQVTVNNPGGAPADPIVTVTAPSGTFTHTLRIFNDSIGVKLTFLNQGADEQFYVDFSDRTAQRVSTAVVYDYTQDIDWSSTNASWWWPGKRGLITGDNIIRQTGGADVQVSFYPRSY